MNGLLCFMTVIICFTIFKPGMALTFRFYDAVFYSNVGNYQQCWIGLYKSTNGEWKEIDNNHWLDGNPSKYRNWDSGEPDGAGSQDRCVIIYNGEFRTVDCGNTYRYVCKGRLSISFRSYFSLVFTARCTSAQRGIEIA